MYEESKEYQRTQAQAYRRLASEIFIRTFNDILTKRYYEYYTAQAMLHPYRRDAHSILQRHHDSIHWLMHNRDHWAFQVLGYHFSERKMMTIIVNKYNGNERFHRMPKDDE